MTQQPHTINWIPVDGFGDGHKLDLDARYTAGTKCECGGLIELVDSGDGYTFWGHVKRTRIAFQHAAVPAHPAETATPAKELEAENRTGAWIDTLAKGDVVAVYSKPGLDAHVAFTTVTHTTTTQIVCADGRRYRRDASGREIGGRGRGEHELMPVGSNAVRNVVARRNFSWLRFRVWDLGKDETGDATVVLAKVDKVEQMIRQVRAGIADPTLTPPQV